MILEIPQSFCSQGLSPLVGKFKESKNLLDTLILKEVKGCGKNKKRKGKNVCF